MSEVKRYNWHHLGMLEIDKGAMVLASDYDALRTEMETLKQVIADPKAVHVNILRGTIALTREQGLHIGGAEQLHKDNEKLQARVREMEKTILTAYDMLEYKDYGAAFIQLSNCRLAILNGNYLGNLKPKGPHDER